MTEQDVVRSLYEVIPGYSLHMEEFLRLFRVRFEEKRVDSAAMTCGDRAELLLNPKFLEERCKTPEHLLMLVLHELYHALLGHTRLFLHPTQIDNIAFDAIINATLVRAFPGEEFRSFFEGNNPSGSFPGCLLRPVAEDTPEDCRDLVEALYLGNHVTYEEIYDLIVRKMMEGGLPEGGFLLIGNHRGAGKGSPMLRKALEKAMGGWPDGLLKVGRSADGERMLLSLCPENSREKKDRARMRRLLRLVLARHRGGGGARAPRIGEGGLRAVDRDRIARVFGEALELRLNGAQRRAHAAVGEFAADRLRRLRRSRERKEKFKGKGVVGHDEKKRRGPREAAPFA